MLGTKSGPCGTNIPPHTMKFSVPNLEQVLTMQGFKQVLVLLLLSEVKLCSDSKEK